MFVGMGIGQHTRNAYVVCIPESSKHSFSGCLVEACLLCQFVGDKPMQRSDQSRGLGDFQVGPTVFTLDKVIRSDARAVDDLVGEITGVLKRLDWCDDIDLVDLAIREAVTNALVHGNRCDPEKTITISVALKDDGGLFVSVKDSGSGFDPKALPNPLAAENLLSNHGRGIFLMRQFMDEVEFNFDHGTEVRMCRRQKWFE
jgi:serine/threonine-protein kinase RsbW